MVHIITRLGFLPRNKVPENHELELCNELWTVVRGEENSGVSYDTLRVMMLNMIGLRTKDRETSNRADQQYESRIESDLNESAAPGDTSTANPESGKKQQKPIDITKLGLFD